MSDIATPDFLAHLKSLFPDRGRSVLDNPWSLYAGVAFSASNVPEAVPVVFHYALEGLKRESSRSSHDMHEAQLSLARRMRESVFRAGMLNGYGRVRSLFTVSRGLIRDSPLGNQCSRCSARGNARRAEGHTDIEVCYADTGCHPNI